MERRVGFFRSSFEVTFHGTKVKQLGEKKLDPDPHVPYPFSARTRVIFQHVPSRKLTYPPKMAF